MPKLFGTGAKTTSILNRTKKANKNERLKNNLTLIGIRKCTKLRAYSCMLSITRLRIRRDQIDREDVKQKASPSIIYDSLSDS